MAQLSHAIGRVRLTFAYGFIATLYVFGVPLPKLASIYKRACGDAPGGRSKSNGHEARPQTGESVHDQQNR